MSVAQEVAQAVGHDDRQLILEPSALGPAHHLIGYNGGTEDNIAEVVVIVSCRLGESSLLNVLLEEGGRVSLVLRRRCLGTSQRQCRLANYSVR